MSFLYLCKDRYFHTLLVQPLWIIRITSTYTFNPDNLLLDVYCRHTHVPNDDVYEVIYGKLYVLAKDWK